MAKTAHEIAEELEKEIAEMATDLGHLRRSLEYWKDRARKESGIEEILSIKVPAPDAYFDVMKTHTTGMDPFDD